MPSVKILFVCLGNICRSPLAEAIFVDKIARKNLTDQFEVDSCGTSNYHIGDQPDARSIATAHKNGIKISHHCRQLTSDDLETFDYILAMDEGNYENILRLSRNKKHAEKVFLMREFDVLGKGEEVPDPYFGGEREFQEVYDILNRSTENFLSFVESNKAIK